jgi:hypothetical protein
VINAVSLPRSLIRRLGKVPDNILARQYGIYPGRVRTERIRRQIPSARPAPSLIAWTPAMLTELGTAPDPTVASRWGLSTASINIKRRSLGIPAFRARSQPPQSIPWTPSLVKLIGKRPDAELARSFDVPRYRIRIERLARGQRAPGWAGRVEWTREMLMNLRTLTTGEFVKRYRISPATVAEKRRELGIVSTAVRPIRWTDQLIRLLGQISDRELARRVGCSRDAVRRKRRALCVRPFPESMRRRTGEPTGSRR